MIDITSILFEQRRKPRGDETAAHAADTHGCDRATWYRRHGYTPRALTAEKYALFDQGHAYEAGVRERLQAAGRNVYADTITLRGAIGHTDMTDPDGRAVYDAKFSVNAPPKTFASPHYILATAFYVLSYGWTDGAVIHGNARPGIGVIEKQYNFRTGDLAHDTQGKPFSASTEWYGLSWEEIVLARVAQIHARTGPYAETPPPADPGELSPWKCRYCDWLHCERNPAYDADAEIPA